MMKLLLSFYILFFPIFAVFGAMTIDDISGLTETNWIWNNKVSRDNLTSRTVLFISIAGGSSDVSISDEAKKNSKATGSRKFTPIKLAQMQTNRYKKNGLLTVVFTPEDRFKAFKTDLGEDPLLKTLKASRIFLPIYAGLSFAGSKESNSTAQCYLFDYTGKLVFSGSIYEMVDSKKMQQTIDAAPEYIEGMLVAMDMPKHPGMNKQLIEGRNIDPVISTLTSHAKANNETGTEAKAILEKLNNWLKDKCDEIDADLKNRPSLAIDLINTLSKTSPKTAKKYAKTAANLKSNKMISTLVLVRGFLDKVDNEEFDKRNSEVMAAKYIKQLDPFLKNKNPSIVSDTEDVIAACKQIASENEAAKQRSRERIKAKQNEQKAEAEAANLAKRGLRNATPDKPKRESKPKDSLYTYLVNSLNLNYLEPFESDFSNKPIDVSLEALAVQMQPIAKKTGTLQRPAEDLISAIEEEKKRNLDLVEDALKTHNYKMTPDDFMLMTKRFPSFSKNKSVTQLSRIVKNSDVVALNNAIEKMTETMNDSEASPSKQASSIRVMRRTLKSVKTEFGKEYSTFLQSSQYKDAELAKREDDLKKKSASAKDADAESNRRNRRNK